MTIQDLAEQAGSIRALAISLGYDRAYTWRVVVGKQSASGAFLRRVKERLGVVIDPETSRGARA